METSKSIELLKSIIDHVIEMLEKRINLLRAIETSSTTEKSIKLFDIIIELEKLKILEIHQFRDYEVCYDPFDSFSIAKNIAQIFILFSRNEMNENQIKAMINAVFQIVNISFDNSNFKINEKSLIYKDENFDEVSKTVGFWSKWKQKIVSFLKLKNE